AWETPLAHEQRRLAAIVVVDVVGYSPTAAYARGLADLQVLANLIPAREFVHGAKPTSIDAAVYGFIANIYFLEIDTPLKKFVVAAPDLVRHCTTIHAAIG